MHSSSCCAERVCYARSVPPGFIDIGWLHRRDLGCADGLRKNTRNAPTSAQANLNSLQAAVGSVYLYDMTSGAAIYRVRFQATEVTSNRGNFLHRASSGISVDLRNVPPAAATDVANAVSLAVGNSLKFEMSQYEQRNIAEPEGVLNAQVPLEWFADRERTRANDPGYRHFRHRRFLWRRNQDALGRAGGGRSFTQSLHSKC